MSLRFAQLVQEIYGRPCLINPQAHQVISNIFMKHYTGEAASGDLMAAGDLRLAANAQKNGDSGTLSIQGDIAIINIAGPITQRVPQLFKDICGMTDLTDLTTAFKEAEANPRIAGILQNFDTPGGSVTGVPEYGNMVANCSKPVVSFSESMCDSAGYWMGSGADAFVATESSSVGCIGVYMAFLDQSRALELRGLDVELFKTGTFKGMGYPGTTLTEEHRAHLQAEVDEIHQWFTGHVLEHRIISGEDTFEGQDFFGREAKKRGLVDDVGDFDFAVEELRTLIEMRG